MLNAFVLFGVWAFGGLGIKISSFDDVAGADIVTAAAKPLRVLSVVRFVFRTATSLLPLLPPVHILKNPPLFLGCVRAGTSTGGCCDSSGNWCGRRRLCGYLTDQYAFVAKIAVEVVCVRYVADGSKQLLDEASPDTSSGVDKLSADKEIKHSKTICRRRAYTVCQQTHGIFSCPLVQRILSGRGRLEANPLHVRKQNRTHRLYELFEWEEYFPDIFAETLPLVITARLREKTLQMRAARRPYSGL